MPLDSIQGEDDVLAKLREIPGVDVSEGEYTDDSYVPKVDPATQMFKPYLLIKWNAAFPTNDNGIVGPEKDTLRNSFSVYVVSPDDRTTRIIRNQVREKMLTNFAPTDGSALKPTGGFSFVDADLGYNRFAHNIGFSYWTNLS